MLAVGHPLANTILDIKVVLLVIRLGLIGRRLRG
jgi:hypothetical protein